MFNRINLYRLVFLGYSRKSAEIYIKKYLGNYKKRELQKYRKYLWVNPISGKYNNLTSDQLMLRYILDDFKENLVGYYFQIIERNNTRVLMSLQDMPDSIDSVNGINSLAKLSKRVGRLQFVNPLNRKTRDHLTIEWNDNKWYINNHICSQGFVEEVLSKIPNFYIGIEKPNVNSNLRLKYHTEDLEIKIIICKESEGTPVILGGYFTSDSQILDEFDEEGIVDKCWKIPQWNSIKEFVLRISSYYKELQFMGIDLILMDDGFKLIDVQSNIDIPDCFFENDLFQRFVNNKYIEKKASLTIRTRLFMMLKEIYNDYAAKKGFMGFMYKNWQRDLLKDWTEGTASIKEKRWAHKRGFLSYRIKQYNLDNDTYNHTLSDREYRMLRPINGESVNWVYDKVIMRYVLHKKRYMLPKHYFHLMIKNNLKQIVRLQDCSMKYSADMEGILDLLKNEKNLIVKPSEGSHGEGVIKLSYHKGSYFINNSVVAKQQITTKLKSLDGCFNITEYIEMHTFLKKIYEKCTYTVRIMVINRTGLDPWIADAYIRIATNSTGVTDNIADGGICAKINVNSGEICNPERIINHNITPCPIHPDTNVPIKGTLPNWGIVKKDIESLCKYIGQLEYMGLDVVITEKGCKLLEINTHQDLHRYTQYDKEIHRYFSEKVMARI